jgi:hypothetical protein
MNLEDLGYTSVSDMQTDEALELLRQIRLSRRTPKKATKTRKVNVKVATKVDANQAAELLKILTGGGN